MGLARWREEAIHVLVAVQFLTRIPVTLARFEPVWLDRSIAYFPLVGALVGAVCAGVLLAAAALWPQPIPAILAVAAGIAVTGAFHEDGLADTADGLGGGQTAEQRLLIMKDSRIGTYGTVTLMCVLLAKIAAVAAMPVGTAAWALVAAYAGGRLVPVVASAVMPYAGDLVGAKVQPMRPSGPRIAVACVLALAAFLTLPVLAALAAATIGGVAAALLLAKARALIGGQTGDVLGAAEQVFEATALLVLAGL